MLGAMRVVARAGIGLAAAATTLTSPCAARTATTGAVTPSAISEKTKRIGEPDAARSLRNETSVATYRRLIARLRATVATHSSNIHLMTSVLTSRMDC